jgi:hypothetical protein
MTKERQQAKRLVARLRELEVNPDGKEEFLRVCDYQSLQAANVLYAANYQTSTQQSREV